MALIEKGLKWSLIGVVGLMVFGTVGSTVVAGMIGLMSDPSVIVFVLVAFVGFLVLLVAPMAIGGMWLYRWWRMAAINERQAAEFIAPDEQGRLPVPASLLRTPEFANRAIDSHQASYLANLTTFHYSPESNQNITGADGQTMTDASAVAPDTFWKIYQAGQLPSKGF
jgi:hypothetical protein